MCAKFWWENTNERDHSEDRGVDGRMESEWVLRRLAGEYGVDSVGSGYGPTGKHDDKPSGLAPQI
jgi:hypothetical protein